MKAKRTPQIKWKNSLQTKSWRAANKREIIYACAFACEGLGNKIDRPNTTPTVRAICMFAVYFSVFRPFSRFSLFYEGHRRYCIIRRKLQPLDYAMANLKRSKLCVIFAVIFSWVWHLCYLPCVSVFFWLSSIARYVFKSPSICFLGQKYDRVYCECAVTCILNCDAGPGYY